MFVHHVSITIVWCKIDYFYSRFYINLYILICFLIYKKYDKMYFSTNSQKSSCTYIVLEYQNSNKCAKFILSYTCDYINNIADVFGKTFA